MSIPPDPIPDVTFDRVAAFVRLVTHDVRNGLNAIDLQSSFLTEIAEDAEVKEEAGKLREMVAHVTRAMQELSSRFGEVRPSVINYPAREFMESLAETAERQLEAKAKQIVWDIHLNSEEISLDFNLLTAALVELLRNALFFRQGEDPIHLAARAERGSVVFSVSQARAEPPAEAPSRWGRAPLVSERRGGYGLGLFHVRRILDALGGTWDAQYDPATRQVMIRLSFPITVE